MVDVDYEKENYKLNIISNLTNSKVDMFIKNTKFDIGFKVDIDSCVGVIVERITHTNLFRSKTKTEETNIYDEHKGAKYLLDLGKAIIDFLLEIEKLIAIDEKEKAEHIFKTLQYGIKDFKE